MSALRLVGLLIVGGVGAAPAQLARIQPTEKLLVLPLALGSAVDTATSVAVADVTRERTTALARNRLVVITKDQICRLLTASGFACNMVIDGSGIQQMADALKADAYTTGILERAGGHLRAQVRVVDIGGAGIAYRFTAENGNPGSPAELGNAIAERLGTIARAGESARECSDQRSKGALPKALDAARKALQVDPNLPAAHLCTALVYEAQRQPPDSVIAAARRALRGDSLNGQAWRLIFSQSQVKGDTAGMLEAIAYDTRGDPGNTARRLGYANLLFQIKRYPDAMVLLDDGLARQPGDKGMLDLKARVCIEGEMWTCAAEALHAQAEHDSTRLADTTFLMTAIGAAQKANDAMRSIYFGREASARYPRNAAFVKSLGAGFELAGRTDSAVATYLRALALEPTNVASALLVAQAMVNGAVYDTAAAGRCRGDTACLRPLRQALADKMAPARPYIDRGLASRDSAHVLSATVFMFTAGSKLAQSAQAYDRAYPWLDDVLRLLEPRGPSDTTGPRQQVRVNASFWWGLSSVQTLAGPFKTMVDSKDCGQAKALNDRLARTRQALERGRRVHPPTVASVLANLKKYEDLMPQVRRAYKCRNF